jgi:hypothetical protein
MYNTAKNMILIFVLTLAVGCGGSDSATLVTEPTPEQEQKLKDHQLAVDQQEKARPK